MKKQGKPEDIIIGANVRRLRSLRGWSQTDLATEMGLTFQQVQKYEKGSNRIGGSRMVQMARALKVPINALFEGIDIANGKAVVDPYHEFAKAPGAQTLVTIINQLKTPKDRAKVVRTCTSVAELLLSNEGE